MKKSFIYLLSLVFITVTHQTWAQNQYHLIVEGFDWGPAVNKVVLAKGKAELSTTPSNYQVLATRSIAEAENPIMPASGERTVLSAYRSDGKGNRSADGAFVTLNLLVSPSLSIGSPFQYLGRQGNVWVDYQLSITNTQTLETWDEEAARVLPLVDQFDLTGQFTHGEIDLTYASFQPKTDKANRPLIIWLHGGGEGGTDPTVPLLANRAANYASDEIQDYFGGAYVLVPQTPTYWMDSGSGYTRGDRDDIYFKALKALIDEYVEEHPGIDKDRIHVGGCSNGGYMSLKLIIENPDYFAAGYISALAYSGEFFSDAQAKQIRKVPIWFVHSKDDGTTAADDTVIPVYEKLVNVGAKNVHLSMYEHVYDITGLYGGKDYLYPGHFSWIYSHANKAQRNYDGSPVLEDGVPVTIMQWLALQEQ